MGEKKIVYSLDEVFTHIGIGKYHLLLESLLIIALLPAAIHTFILHFSSLPLRWECAANSTVCNITGVVTPEHAKYALRCSMAKSQWHFVERKEFSIISEFNLDCGGEEKVYWLQTAYFTFGLLGTIFLGWMADKYGRFPLFYSGLVIPTILTFVSAYISNFWAFAVNRCIVGFFEAGMSGAIFVISSETSAPKHRPLMGVALYIVAFPVAMVILAYQAQATMNWKKLFIYSSAPYVVIFPIVWFVPETVRWLRLNNKEKKMMKILRKMAKMNSVTLPENFEIEQHVEKASHLKPSPWHLLNTRMMFYRTSALWIGCFTVAASYLGLTFATNNLGGDLYRDFALSGIVEAPAGILAIITSVKFGRKLSTTVSMFIGGIACLFIPLSPLMLSGSAAKWLRLFFGIIGKLFITLGYDTIFVWAVELYPTIIRSEALSLLGIALGCGSAASPWISKWLLRYHKVLPYAIFSGMAILSCFMLSFLPETEHMETMEDIEDLKILARGSQEVPEAVEAIQLQEKV